MKLIFSLIFSALNHGLYSLHFGMDFDLFCNKYLVDLFSKSNGWNWISIIYNNCLQCWSTNKRFERFSSDLWNSFEVSFQTWISQIISFNFFSFFQMFGLPSFLFFGILSELETHSHFGLSTTNFGLCTAISCPWESNSLHKTKLPW